jgi:hypothetical protein
MFAKTEDLTEFPQIGEFPNVKSLEFENQAINSKIFSIPILKGQGQAWNR